MLTPNPLTSGGARWNVLAAYGAQLKLGKTPKQAEQYLYKLFHHVPVQDKSARDALNTFLGGKGDALLTYENEALLAQRSGQPVVLQHPEGDDPDRQPASPRSARARTRRRRRAFVKFLYTPAAQKLFAQSGYRPVAPERDQGLQLPGAAEAVHDRLPRRLDEGAEEVLRPEQGTDGEDRGEPWRLTPRRCARPRRTRAPSVRRGWSAADSSPATSASIVLLPLAALAARTRATSENAVTNREAMSALKLTLVLALLVALVNAVVGTATAWVLVRDDFRGKRIVNAVIDLPFALPTIVAGLTLLALYGPRGASGINLAYTRAGVLVALLFVTLPFVVRAVQPVLLELDTEMEEAAASLGARPTAIFRRIVFPNLLPAILSGVALAFARAVGEFGAVVLISGNLPFKTEMASVYIFGRIQSNDAAGAAVALARAARDLVRDPAPGRRAPPLGDEA